MELVSTLEVRLGDMRHMARMPLFAFILLALTSAAVACDSKPASSLDSSLVREYADIATETCLQGLSDHDLEKYTQYANEEFKAAVTQQILDTAATQINSKLGAYKFKEFLRTEEQQGYTIVHYKATYANGEQGVRMVFDKDHLVAGQWFE